MVFNGPTSFILTKLYALRGRGGRVDIVVSDVTLGHTLVDIVVAYPTRRNLVERAARHDLVAATDAERRKVTHYRDCAAGTKFVPFALETYGALSDRSDRFLVECATLASRECAESRPSISLLCTWFRQRVSIAMQRSLAHAIHARTLRLEQSMLCRVTSPTTARSTFFFGVAYCC